jgi:hypothetical protein
MMNMRFTEVMVDCFSDSVKADLSLLAWGGSVRQRSEGYNNISSYSNSVRRCKREVCTLAADVNDLEPR